MKVILQGYNTCCQNKSGGINKRINAFKTRLANQSIDVELFNPFETKLEDADIIHFFMPGFENYSLIEFAASLNKKIVISTVVSIKVDAKKRLYKYLDFLPIMTTQKLLKQSLSLADALITESNRECNFIKDFYGIKNKRIELLPNGIDPINYEGEEIYEKLSKRCKYILHVGRFDENKNQLNVIKAMKGTGVDVVFIGGADPLHLEYYKECFKQTAGEPNFHFLGWLDSDSNLLKSAYAKADVFVLPSYRETFGLVALEAGSAGAKLAFSKKLPILEYEAFNGCPRFDPSDCNDIRNILLDCFHSEKSLDFQRNIINNFSWDVIIKRLIKIYESLL